MAVGGTRTLTPSRPKGSEQGSGRRRALLLVWSVCSVAALSLAACSDDTAAPAAGELAPRSAPTSEDSPASAPDEPLDPPLLTAADGPVQVDVAGAVQGVHDPMVAVEDGTFHLFSTGAWIEHRTSTDLVHWEQQGSVFDELPDWVAAELDYEPTNLWAPDVSWWGGAWHLYYSASVWPPGEFPTRDSAIAHATTPTLDPDDPDYGWVDHGPVVRSAGPLIGDRSGWNAIDPTVVLDEAHDPWLAWGSGFDGLFLQPLLDDGTVDEAVEPINIARRVNHPILVIEAPTIVRRGDWWYLFASYDLCCNGVRSTYNVRVGRSRHLTGPYVDREGRALVDGGGTKILSAYGAVRGPGHQTVHEQGGEWWLIHHWYDEAADGIATLGIRPLDWDDEGWPSVRGWSEAIALPGAASGQP